MRHIVVTIKNCYITDSTTIILLEVCAFVRSQDKRKRKKLLSSLQKNIYVYIKTCGNSQTIISSSGYEVCLENYQAIDKDCVNVDGQCTTTKLADWGGVGKDQDHWGGVGKDQGL